MAAYVLITGALFHKPESRVSETGKPVATATLVVKDVEDDSFFRL
jgi:hypothetical protein